MSQQQSLQVELGDRSYPIHVGDLGVQVPEKLAQLLQPLIPGPESAAAAIGLISLGLVLPDPLHESDNSYHPIQPAMIVAGTSILTPLS